MTKQELEEDSQSPELTGVSAPISSAPLAANAIIRARAILLGLLLLPLNAYWVIQMESVRYSAHPTTISLFFNCIFFLVVLVGINKILARVRQSWVLTQAELLLIYSMLCIGSCMAAHDFTQVLVPTLAWPYAFSNHANNYLGLFGQYLPREIMSPDINATHGFFRGHDTLYTRAHILAWLPAVTVWTAFVGVLLWIMQCVNVLIRKQWTENEHLSYPLVRLPVELAATHRPGESGGVPLTRNRLFWIGFFLAAGIDLVNSLNYYYPSIPPILAPGNGQSMLDLHQFVVTKPWNAIGWTPVTFYPFVIGLGMQLPMEFLFSSWFFYLTWKLEAVGTVAFGFDSDPRAPYVNYQALGAYLLFFVSTIWLSRHYLKEVFRRALGRPSTIDDRDEPIRYRSAVVGIVVGALAFVLFCAALGMVWWLALAFIFLYFALALAITRMRAEMGTPVHDLHFTGPDWTLTDLLGPRALGPQNLAVLSLFYWFNRAYRAHPMPFQLEGLKMAEMMGGAKRQMRIWIFAMMLAGVFGMICSFWAILHCGYIFGTQRFGAEAWDRYASWMTSPKPPNSNVALAIVVGFVIAAILQVLRTNTIMPLPLHPLAFAVSSSWEMNLLWMPLLIAWAIKGLILRYGGAKMFQRAMPLFYGLILGQFIPGSLLNIWGIITTTPTYQFWQ